MSAHAPQEIVRGVYLSALVIWVEQVKGRIHVLTIFEPLMSKPVIAQEMKHNHNTCENLRYGERYFTI